LDPDDGQDSGPSFIRRESSGQQRLVRDVPCEEKGELVERHCAEQEADGEKELSPIRSYKSPKSADDPQSFTKGEAFIQSRLGRGQAHGVGCTEGDSPPPEDGGGQRV